MSKESSQNGLDEEKAFDSVNWSFSRLCIGFIFTKLSFRQFSLFFLEKKTKNSENYNKWLPSGSFELERCWHQGCPISPLLFTLFVEPLSQLIRQNHEVHGVSLAGDHKIALFADDVLIYLTCPEFWSVSGYKGNSYKSQLLTTSQQFRDNHAIREVEYEISGWADTKIYVKNNLRKL